MEGMRPDLNPLDIDHILERIFQVLSSTDDLLNCRLVNNGQWKPMASRVLNSRGCTIVVDETMIGTLVESGLNATIRLRVPGTRENPPSLEPLIKILRWEENYAHCYVKAIQYTTDPVDTPLGSRTFRLAIPSFQLFNADEFWRLVELCAPTLNSLTVLAQFRPSMINEIECEDLQFPPLSEMTVNYAYDSRTRAHGDEEDTTIVTTRNRIKAIIKSAPNLTTYNCIFEHTPWVDRSSYWEFDVQQVQLSNVTRLGLYYQRNDTNPDLVLWEQYPDENSACQLWRKLGTVSAGEYPSLKTIRTNFSAFQALAGLYDYWEFVGADCPPLDPEPPPSVDTLHVVFPERSFEFDVTADMIGRQVSRLEERLPELHKLVLTFDVPMSFEKGTPYKQSMLILHGLFNLPRVDYLEIENYWRHWLPDMQERIPTWSNNEFKNMKINLKHLKLSVTKREQKQMDPISLGALRGLCNLFPNLTHLEMDRGYFFDQEIIQEARDRIAEFRPALCVTIY